MIAWDTFLIADLGCNGAMFVARIGSSGPQIVSPPYRWKHHNRQGWDRHHEDVENQWRYLLQRHRPRVVAVEKPKSVMGREHVGISQSYFVGRFALMAEQAAKPPEIIQVPGQYGANRMKAWAILRSSFGEIVDGDELRELADNEEGRPGEHVTDGCAIFLAAIPRWQEIKKRETEAIQGSQGALLDAPGAKKRRRRRR